MYIVLNTELNMSKGKIASQSAHAACDVVEYLVKNPNPLYYRWKKDGQAKIVLKGNTKQMEEMEDIFNDRSKNIWCSSIRDVGKTEVNEGSLTAVAFSPNKKKDIPEIIKKLKLL